MTEQQEHGFVQMVKRYFPDRGAVMFTLKSDGRMDMAMVSTNAHDRGEYLGVWALIKRDTDGPDADPETNTIRRT